MEPGDESAAEGALPELTTKVLPSNGQVRQRGGPYECGSLLSLQAAFENMSDISKYFSGNNAVCMSRPVELVGDACPMRTVTEEDKSLWRKKEKMSAYVAFPRGPDAATEKVDCYARFLVGDMQPGARRTGAFFCFPRREGKRRWKRKTPVNKAVGPKG